MFHDAVVKGINIIDLVILLGNYDIYRKRALKTMHDKGAKKKQESSSSEEDSE